MFALFIGAVWRSSSEALRRSLYVYTNHPAPPKGPFKMYVTQKTAFFDFPFQLVTICHILPRPVTHQKVTNSNVQSPSVLA